MPFQLEQFQSALNSNGLASALAVLNQPVHHRYTGVYRLHGGNLVNIELFDKQGEMKPEFLQEVPLQDSFCQFVLRDGVLQTGNSGELFGTLCHFDALQRELPDDHFRLLQQAARLLAPHLPR